jgi:hypothetical protein
LANSKFSKGANVAGYFANVNWRLVLPVYCLYAAIMVGAVVYYSRPKSRAVGVIPDAPRAEIREEKPIEKTRDEGLLVREKPEPVKLPIKRGMFEALAGGRFSEEIIQMYGPPDYTTQGQILTMYYLKKTIDDNNGRIDQSASIEFAPAGCPAARVRF